MERTASARLGPDNKADQSIGSINDPRNNCTYLKLREPWPLEIDEGESFHYIGSHIKNKDGGAVAV